MSRLFGLVRQRVLARLLGLGDANDAFNAAFRIPNLLQNLFGEGVLSASFIPVYARLRAEGREAEAEKVAGAVVGLLALTASLLVLAAVLLAAPLIDLVAPGFEGEKRELTIQLVRLLFPGAGLLVLSAWCLGILNSHRRFFLSYAAPVIWNLAIIARLIVAAGRGNEAGIAIGAAIGLGCRGRTPGAGPAAHGAHPAPGHPSVAGHRIDPRQDSPAELRSGVRRTGRGPDQRLRRQRPGQPAPAPGR